jgi:hypothetical protein
MPVQTMGALAKMPLIGNKAMAKDFEKLYKV